MLGAFVVANPHKQFYFKSVQQSFIVGLPKIQISPTYVITDLIKVLYNLNFVHWHGDSRIVKKVSSYIRMGQRDLSGSAGSPDHWTAVTLVLFILR